jgi:hypothetical protein
LSLIVQFSCCLYIYIYIYLSGIHIHRHSYFHLLYYEGSLRTKIYSVVQSVHVYSQRPSQLSSIEKKGAYFYFQKLSSVPVTQLRRKSHDILSVHSPSPPLLFFCLCFWNCEALHFQFRESVHSPSPPLMFFCLCFWTNCKYFIVSAIFTSISL